MAKLYPVKLTPSERETLRAMTTKGRHSALRQRRARTLLLADEGRSDQRIAEALQIARATVERTRRRCFEEGVEVALSRRAQRRPSKRPKLDGEKEAPLVALACSPPPQGHSQWSLRLLADRLVALQIVESCSDETVRRPLGKKRAQALAQTRAVVHSARAKRRVRGVHARHLGGVHPAL